jgi:hypothetical protein
VDEENRDVKRCIEKENNKFRQKERKSYVEMVKKIVEFAFKRDPRYKIYEKQINEELERRRK